MSISIYLSISLSLSLYIYIYIYTLRTNPGKKLPGFKSYLDRQLSKITIKVADIGNSGLTNPARKKLPISVTLFTTFAVQIIVVPLQVHYIIITTPLQYH